VDSRGRVEDELEELGSELFDLHELMFAHESSGVLLVLQGTDASGKNGTIKQVINRVNPAGVLATELGSGMSIRWPVAK
jgi:polyphosphate kinase 2 (PPK2 family)